MYSGKHVHEPALFCSLQTAFAPHGDGLQGWTISGGGAEIQNILGKIVEQFF